MGGGRQHSVRFGSDELLTPEAEADYIVTGSFAQKAYEEAARIGKVNIAATTKDTNFDRLPGMDEIKLSQAPVYVHFTSNNTIFGTQWQSFPEFKGDQFNRG